MEYLIRKCTEKDLSQLIELCGKHADFEQAIYNSTGKEALLKKALFTDTPKLFCYVVESENDLQGYFTFTFDYSTWDAKTFLYLDCLYLEPEYRGHRIGEVIFEKLTEIAKQNSCVNIQWQTPIFNERAIKFYKRIGGIGKEKLRFFIDTQQTD